MRNLEAAMRKLEAASWAVPPWVLDRWYNALLDVMNH